MATPTSKISGMLSDENIIIQYKIDESLDWRFLNIQNPIISIENSSYGKHKIK